MPSVLDIVFAVLFFGVMAGFEHIYLGTKFKKQIAAGVPTDRRNAYRWESTSQQVMSVIVIVGWSMTGRSWDTLGLVPPRAWRLLVGLGIAVAMAALVARQLRRVRRLGERRRERLRNQLAPVESFLPHTATERRWFVVLSLTAGVCEELLYRGYLTWLLASYVGRPGGVVLVMVCFGLAHAYQGARGFVQAAATSLFLSLIIVLTGWLVPAMIIHVLMDLNSGEIAFATYAEFPAPPLATAA